jgi:hypothetical protein
MVEWLVLAVVILVLALLVFRWVWFAVWVARHAADRLARGEEERAEDPTE